MLKSAMSSSSVERQGTKVSNRFKSSSISSDAPLASASTNKQPQNQQQNQRYTADILNGGSVKSLVQSYEEFPHKEPADSKIIQMREERKKEIDSVVEQCRLAYSADKALLDDENDCDYIDEDEHEAQQVQELQEQKQQQQNRMQKELSTISERTENSPPGASNHHADANGGQAWVIQIYHIQISQFICICINKYTKNVMNYI